MRKKIFNALLNLLILVLMVLFLKDLKDDKMIEALINIALAIFAQAVLLGRKINEVIKK